MTGVQQGMTDGELAAIEARCNAATPGPWWVEFREVWLSDELHYDAVVTTGDADIAGCGAEDECHANALFIADARDAVLALIAEVRRLRGLHPTHLDGEALAAAVEDDCGAWGEA